MKPQRLSYGSDRLIRGRILTRVLNPDVKDISPKMRAFLGSRAIAELDPAFKAFQCKKCGRVDELACFKQGIVSKLVVPKPRPDLHVTEEYFYLWSRRFADLMLKLAGDAVYLFELPADAGYVVPWPKQLIEAPDVIANLGYRHTFRLTDGAALEFNADSHYENGFWGTFDHAPTTHQPAFTKTDVNLTYRAANGQWNVGAWAKNLENRAVIGPGAYVGAGTIGGVYWVLPPRTYGVRLGINW